MRGVKVSGTLLLAAGLGWMDLAGAQPPSPPKDVPPPKAKEVVRWDSMSLDEMLTVALQDNADLRVAEAKVRDAQVERDRLRLQVVNKVRTQKAAIEAQRDMVKVTQNVYDMFTKLSATKVSSDFERLQVQKSLAEAKAKLAEVEAELPYLLGQASDSKSADASGDFCPRLAPGGMKTQDCMACHTTANPAGSPKGLPRGQAGPASGGTGVKTPPIPQVVFDRLRAALDKTVTIEKQVDNASIADILDFMQDKTETAGLISIRIAFGSDQPPVVRLSTGSLPWGAWFQMMEDSSPELIFLVRDYGILATTRGGLRGRNLPPGTLTVNEFWKIYGKPAAPYMN
jgi:hypothetical protein